MQMISSVLLLLTALPALADEMPKPTPPAIQIETPPSPPPVLWQVWGYKLTNDQWVQQPRHCLKTTNLQKAIDYFKDINAVHGWRATTNVPDFALAPPSKRARSAADHGRTITRSDRDGQHALGGGYVRTSDGRIVYDSEYSPGGRTIYGRHATIRIGRDANRNIRSNNDDWAARQQQQSMDDFQTQQFNNTQDWVNQQLLDASNQMTQAQQNNP